MNSTLNALTAYTTAGALDLSSQTVSAASVLPTPMKQDTSEAEA